MPMEVREIKEVEYDLWDELVERSSQGTIFDKSFWLESSGALLNKEFRIYGSFKENHLVGGCPLYIGKHIVLNFATSKVDMTPYGGILLEGSSTSKVREQEAMYNDIVLSLCKEFGDIQIQYIKLTNSPYITDIRPFTWEGWVSKVFYTYYFSLDGNIDESISKKARNTIRKAAKSNLIIKKSTDSDSFYDLLIKTYKRQGSIPPVNKRFMEKKIELIESEGAGGMWVAETDSGTKVAAEMILWDKKRAYRWSAALNPDYRDLGATSLLLYDIFGYLKEKGFSEIDLMAANTPKLAKFISGFNPRLIPYYSVERKTIWGRLGEVANQWLKKLR